MGKGDEEQNIAGSSGSEESGQNVEPRLRCTGSRWRRLVGLRCFLVVLLSFGVFLSALFWLPPFLQLADQEDLDLDSRFKGHDIVASFNLEKPFSLLEDYSFQLQNDIFYEIGAPTTKVVILDLKSTAGSNTTKVVFAVDPEVKYSKISPTDESLVKASFESLVTEQSSLRLTKSLFGQPSLFEVLKFRGGITVIPPQNVFLLQKEQILFNFTLNFSIYQIQANFYELTSQLKSGLRLAPYENLYISLSNSNGSTVDPPTVVTSSVLLAIGNNPSMHRLKQLAQTITGSHSRNLGLNHTVFGRVKQVRLSSILQHSLHGGDSNATSWSPSPAPSPHPHQNHHRHGHHHHHHHLAPAVSPASSTENGTRRAPEAAPAPHNNSPAPRKSSPAPQKGHEVEPPGCQFRNKTRFRGKTRRTSHSAPTVAPSISPHHSFSSPKHQHQQVPAPSPRLISHSVPASSPLPHVAFAHAQPPSKSESDEQHLDKVPSVSPSPLASSTSAGHQDVQWTLPLLLAIILHL